MMNESSPQEQPSPISANLLHTMEPQAARGTFGEQLAAAIRQYLVQNNCTVNGQPSLGKINGKILAELADRFYAKWTQAVAPVKPKRTRVAVPKTDGPGTKIPPTQEEVQQHYDEMGYTFGVQKFLAHYGSNGWKVGKVPMVNWHYACRTFQGDLPRRPGAPQQQQQHGIPEPAGWREFAKGLMDPTVAERWNQLDHSTRLLMLKQMNTPRTAGPSVEDVAQKMQDFLKQSTEALTEGAEQ